MAKKRHIKRHFVEIWRPPAALDDRGQPTGPGTKIAEEVPAAIIEKTGTELELAQQVVGNKSVEVELYSDPAWQLAVSDYFVVMDSGRRLEIVEIRDHDLTEWEVVCVCGELLE